MTKKEFANKIREIDIQESLKRVGTRYADPIAAGAGATIYPDQLIAVAKKAIRDNDAKQAFELLYSLCAYQIYGHAMTGVSEWTEDMLDYSRHQLMTSAVARVNGRKGADAKIEAAGETDNAPKYTLAQLLAAEQVAGLDPSECDTYREKREITKVQSDPKEAEKYVRTIGFRYKPGFGWEAPKMPADLGAEPAPDLTQGKPEPEVIDLDKEGLDLFLPDDDGGEVES